MRSFEVTPSQSREARRELGLSQMDVATAIGVNRAYISDFENGSTSRLTKGQVRKLREFFEAQIEEARSSGEEIEITFGDDEKGGAPTAKVEDFVGKRFIFEISQDVSEETYRATLAAQKENRRRLAELLAQPVERETAVFSSGELSEATLQTLRDAFSLATANELMTLSLCGWPEAGLRAGDLSIVSDTVLSLVVENSRDVFAKAGLIAGANLEKGSVQ